MSEFDNLKKKIRKKIELSEDQEDREIYTLMLEMIIATDYGLRRKVTKS